jgi:hypothetical protein
VAAARDMSVVAAALFDMTRPIEDYARTAYDGNFAA